MSNNSTDSKEMRLVNAISGPLIYASRVIRTETTLSNRLSLENRFRLIRIRNSYFTTPFPFGA